MRTHRDDATVDAGGTLRWLRARVVKRPHQRVWLVALLSVTTATLVSTNASAGMKARPSRGVSATASVTRDLVPRSEAAAVKAWIVTNRPALGTLVEIQTNFEDGMKQLPSQAAITVLGIDCTTILDATSALLDPIPDARAEAFLKTSLGEMTRGANACISAIETKKLARLKSALAVEVSGQKEFNLNFRNSVGSQMAAVFSPT